MVTCLHVDNVTGVYTGGLLLGGREVENCPGGNCEWWLLKQGQSSVNRHITITGNFPQVHLKKTNLFYT